MGKFNEQMARLTGNRWLVVIVGCALFAAALASEEVSMLHDLADPEFPVPKLPVSLNGPHANATKGSVNGPADPGYGQPSAGRTDAQREYDKEQAAVDPKLKLGPLDPGYGQANATIRKQHYESTAQKINSNIADRIQQAVDEQNDQIKQASTMTAIKRQSIKIKNKRQREDDEDDGIQT